MKLCACCFQDQEIRQFINTSSSETGICNYCTEESKLLDAEELLDFFSEFLSIFRSETGGCEVIELIQRDWNTFSDDKIGADILSDLSKAIGSTLTPHTKVSYISDISDCVNYWDVLKGSLKWKRRFLTDAERLDEYGWNSLFYVNAEIDSRISLYRARIHHDGNPTCMQTEEMGSPPQMNTTAGRANPSGIPYLYLSKSEETTLYETRSIFLDILSVGCFVSLGNPIRLVDFTINPSPFNSMGNMVELAKSKLLMAAISIDLSKPMRRFDSELEYIPTQFICEFIRYSTGADGIQFSSSLHKGGVNVVLFDPSMVQCVSVNLHQVHNVVIESQII